MVSRCYKSRKGGIILLVDQKLPNSVTTALSHLEERGFDAYLVGGCVRDSLLGKQPDDWDITTNAWPEMVRSAFSNYPVIDTGIQHGTVTVLIGHLPVEITTYRIDGAYSDHRHPDLVQFTPSLRQDLARRDFTVNALAWSPSSGLIDYFGGKTDLEQGVLRCVGEPEKRFEEDALRILRAVRFASVLGFSIEAHTAAAIHAQKESLREISPERIQKELVKLLCGRDVENIILNYYDVLSTFIPPIQKMAGFEQHNPHHIYSVLEHTARAVSSCRPEPALRLAMLFHDMGKPERFSLDQRGIGHFYGHAGLSAQYAKQLLEKLRFDRATIELVTALVKWHDSVIPLEKKAVKRWLNRLGKEKLELLLQVMTADTLALAPEYHARATEIEQTGFMIRKILDEQECFSLKDLAINGQDLIGIGIPEGKQVGDILQLLLTGVIEEKLPNEREALLYHADWLKGHSK